MSITLRDYQLTDVSAVLAAHQSHQCVIGRAATGLGKAVEVAALASHYSRFGRVLVLVDVKKLVRQLAATIKWYTGVAPGIEMAEERAWIGDGLHEGDRIICSTVQTQYSGTAGRERFRSYDPMEFSFLGLDETELFLAPKAREVVQWYIDGNPSLKVFGCSATPFRTDGVAMAELFSHVAFDRDILWGIDNGWLVPGRQAFVQVSVDFSTLKIRKDEEGEQDYVAAEIAEKINNETTLIELAKGIIHVAGDRKSIVVCPDVASAKAVSEYLCGQKPNCAKCIYGELDDEAKDRLFDEHQGNAFQFLCSVLMLTKGYDDPEIRAVFNCRKTKSKRLYQQILGRGTRPLKGIVDGIATASERKAAIAASAAPDMLMVNMVGIKDSVRDITLVDILGAARDEYVVQRAKEMMAENPGLSAEKALEDAETDVEDARACENVLMGMEAERLDQEDEDEWRRTVDVQAKVDVEYREGLGDSMGGNFPTHEGPIPSRQLAILRKAKLTETEIARLSPASVSELSQKIVYRWKAGLSTYRQSKILARAGYTKSELETMTRDAASSAIEECKANNWQRPRVGA